MNVLVSRRSWALAPILFGLMALCLLGVWAVMEPEALRAAFDEDGHSFFETLTLPFYALIVPLVWMCCPFTGSRRRQVLLSLAVSCVAVMAIVKQLDLHVMAISALYPDVVANFKGTPFKMRFLTGSGIPVGAKLFALAYFALFFGTFAGLLAYFAKALWKGFFALHPVAWSVSFLGGCGVMVQVFDRLPAWWRHLNGLPKERAVDAVSSFCTAFEEGGEMMLAVFGLVAILQSHLLNVRPTEGSTYGVDAVR